MCAGVEINEDPIGLLGGENLFRYAANRPANAWDSLGLDWRDDLIRNSAIVGSVIGAILGASGGGAGGTFCRRFAACLTYSNPGLAPWAKLLQRFAVYFFGKRFRFRTSSKFFFSVFSASDGNKSPRLTRSFTDSSNRAA